MRSSMMLIAIAIGVAAVVALTGVGEAARRYVTSEFASLGTNTLIVLPGKADTSGAGVSGMLIGETARDLTLEDAVAIARHPQIAGVAPIVVGAGAVSWQSRLREVTIIGTNAVMRSIQSLDIAVGSFLPDIDLNIASPVCVIGHIIAEEVVGTSRKVGEWLRVGDTRCRVIGVMAQGGIAGAFNIDESVFVPVASAQQIFNAAGVFRILVETRERDDIPSARQSIIGTLTDRHQGNEDFTVITQDAIASTFDSIFNVITTALAGIAAISLLVAGVLIMNVMLVAVSQRTSEVGLLKAIGATQGQIVTIFITEASWLAALGAALGLGIGYLGTFLLNISYPILDFSAPPWASAAAVSIALICGIVFGIVPARRAAQLDPVFALTH